MQKEIHLKSFRTDEAKMDQYLRQNDSTNYQGRYPDQQSDYRHKDRRLHPNGRSSQSMTHYYDGPQLENHDNYSVCPSSFSSETTYLGTFRNQSNRTSSFPSSDYPKVYAAQACRRDIGPPRPAIKRYEDSTYKENLDYQLSKVDSWEKFPTEMKYLLPHDREKTRKAASTAIKEVMRKKEEILRKEDYCGQRSSKKFKMNSGFDFSKEVIEDIFENLRKNLVFDMGFRVKGLKPSDETNCWCPWGKTMKPWRDCFQLDGFLDEKYSCCDDRRDPNGLMRHLESKMKNCALHFGVYEYLFELYGDLRGVGHKDLYGRNTKAYNLAVATEKKEKDELYNKAIIELEEEKRKSFEYEQEKQRLQAKLQECIEKLKETNKKRYENFEDLEDTFKALNIQRKIFSCAANEKAAPFTNEEEEAFDDLFRSILQCLQFGIGDVKEGEKINIAIEQSFDKPDFDINAEMNKQWTKWNKNKDKKSKKLTTLFENGENTWKFATEWVVNFDAFNRRDKVTIQKEETAIDHGGPTRQFFSQFWKQLDRMTVRFGNHKINLFSCTEGGICPVSDKVLDDEVKQATKDESYQTIKSLNNQINQYYRVVGIVFFRAIVGQHAIAPKAMPRFWRNVILRNCQPNNSEKYPSDNVLIDVQQILEFNIKTARKEVLGKSFGELESDYMSGINYAKHYASKKITRENFVSEFIQTVTVERCSRAIKYMKQGITLDGKADLTVFLSKNHIDLVSKKLFAKASLSANDVIQVMKKRKGIIFEQYQTDFFNGPIKDAIKEMNKEERSLFVLFCTGFNYLPNDNTFIIEVEFSSNNNDLPIAHTCEKQLVLPRNAYNGDKKMFQEKLSQAISYTQYWMTMN